jgi:hypothetical protein
MDMMVPQSSRLNVLIMFCVPEESTEILLKVCLMQCGHDKAASQATDKAVAEGQTGAAAQSAGSQA